jgi:hypothetical protein
MASLVSGTSVGGARWRARWPVARHRSIIVQWTRPLQPALNHALCRESGDSAPRAVCRSMDAQVRLARASCRSVRAVRQEYVADTLSDVFAYVVGGLAVASVAIALLVYYARPAREIWRGDTSRLPIRLGPMIAVTPRTYPSALLCVGTLTVAFALGGIAFALGDVAGARWPEHLLIPAVIMLLVNVVLVPLNWVVEATNRPKFLVPPPYRGQPGSFAAAQKRRQHRRAGLPQTHHLVEIFQVRPELGDDDEPFLVAICADDECGWMEFADDDVLEQSEEEQLRAKAARHTTNVAREVQRRP